MRRAGVCGLALLALTCTGRSRQEEAPAGEALARSSAALSSRTVVIDSTSDFALGGNDEGGVDIADGQVKRAKTMRGVGAWTATTALPEARQGHSTVANAGYFYVLGGALDGGVHSNDVRYAKVGTDGSVGTWVAGRSFATGRVFHSSVAYNGYLYVIGGTTAPNVWTNDVQFARINPDGTVGSWTRTSVFANGRRSHTSVVWGGYLYVIGGWNGAMLNDVQLAPINADGTLGTWSSTTAFPTARFEHTSVVQDGHLCVMGGVDSGNQYLSDVRVATIGADGSVGSWSSTAAFASQRWGHQSVVANGYLYVIGGAASGPLLSEVQVAALQPDGSVGPWAATTSLPTGRYQAAAVAAGGRIYLVGGGEPSSIGDVLVAPLNQNGAVGEWTATTGIPTARWNEALVIHGGYIYSIGGATNVEYLSDVQFAPILPDGTVGTWAATSALPSRRHGRAVAWNGHLYLLGVNGFWQGNLVDVVYASANSDGTLGAWTATTPLPTALAATAAVARNGFVYVIGGDLNNPGATSSACIFAAANPDGTVGAWTPTTRLPGARHGHAAVAYGEYLYAIGGTDPNGIDRNDVQVARFNADGSIGAWAAATALARESTWHTSFAWNGSLYVVGGWANQGTTALNEVHAAPIYSDGKLGAWLDATDIPPVQEGGHYVPGVASSGRVYVPRYDSPGASSPLYSAPLDPAGTLGAWTTATAFPTPRQGHSSVASNGYVYVIGGYDGARLGDVKFAPLSADGTVGSWTATQSLPSARSYGCAAAENGRIYMLGGWSGGSFFNQVLVATAEPDGTLGTWSTTAPFATPREPACAAYAGHLYVVGGSTSEAAPADLSDVQVATVNSDGTLGGWASTTPLPSPRSGRAVAYGGHIYHLAGSTNGVVTPDVLTAPLGADGTVGPWRQTTPLPRGRVAFATVAYNGFLYVVGGGSDAYLDEVLVAPVNSDGSLGSWFTAPW